MKYENNLPKYEVETLKGAFEEEYKSILNNSLYFKVNDNLIFPTKALESFFGINKYNITKHVNKGLSDGKLTEESIFDSVFEIIDDNDFIASQAINLKRRGRPSKAYDFDVLHYIGMNLTGFQGERYRNWVKDITKKYATDGYVIDKERMVNDYAAFKKMDNETKELRGNVTLSSNLVTEIFTKAIDYPSRKKEAGKFISRYHNLLNFAITHSTASGILLNRADADKPNMGLTSFTGKKPSKMDVTNARNYYQKSELMDYIDVNTIVHNISSFFSRKNTYTMEELVNCVEDILRLCNQDILEGYGDIKSGDAKKHALNQYRIFKDKDDDQTKLC